MRHEPILGSDRITATMRWRVSSRFSSRDRMKYIPEPFSLTPVGLAGREFGGFSRVYRIDPLGNCHRRNTCARRSFRHLR